MIGRVKNYDINKGYGFIQGEDGQVILVHFSNINMSGFKKLQIGQLVNYDIGMYKERNTAINVNIIDNYITHGMLTNPCLRHDVEDKSYWCEEGRKLEEEFVSNIVPKLGKNIIIHPEKKNNPQYIDLLNIDLNICADLKVQETPFFTAMKKYGFDPQYTVTFNHKDYINYKYNYPNSIIYWWIKWKQFNWRGITVKPLYGVWEVQFDFMKKQIEKGKAPLHKYKERIGDKINATESYLFDLRCFKQVL